MPYVTTPDGVRLNYEESGRGTPVIFCHEFSGDLRSWQLQTRYFKKKFRCVAFNARGYPPSDVPKDMSSYSQALAVEDIRTVMRHLNIRKAHIVGCSMGSAATLHFGLSYPRMAITLTAVGAGSGSNYKNRAEQKSRSEANARRYESTSLKEILAGLRKAPNRVRLKEKNYRAWVDFGKRFLEHSNLGCANIQRGIQGARKPLRNLGPEFSKMKVPLHLVVGDEDTGALDSSLWLKTVCPNARLTVMPRTGHLVNLEEAEIFNRLTEKFFAEIPR